MRTKVKAGKGWEFQRRVARNKAPVPVMTPEGPASFQSSLSPNTVPTHRTCCLAESHAWCGAAGPPPATSQTLGHLPKVTWLTTAG